jgi:pimeloyl-ACP methyl ester carboxylesterase
VIARATRGIAVAVVLVATAPGLGAPAAGLAAAGDDPPLPPPVEVRAEPQGVTLADPAFEPLESASADFGRLGGSVYQIEMPDDWNGRLFLQMHGFADLRPETSVAPPDIRRYLIEHGYAWGASSFSSTSFIPGRAADETAALWDFFAQKYGRPTRSYISGYSMGGLATHIAAERYPNRFDGAFAMCGAASIETALDGSADYFAAGAYAAGLLQTDFDASGDVAALINDRIVPGLNEPAAHRQFEDLMIDLTGGPRAYGREGFRTEEQTNWRRSEWVLAAGLASNVDTKYALGPVSDVPSDHFNEFAIRLPANQALLREFTEGPDVTGDLQMPMLTMHSTGDGQVPIEQARILRRRVADAGRSDLLVQRVVRDPGHCGFRVNEQEAAFEALVKWVEHDARPKGTNLGVRDLRKLDRTFELAAREGTTGSSDRVRLRGRLSLDGEPLVTEFVGAVVLRDGLVSPCQANIPAVANGRYEILIHAETEVRGCGTKGARVVLWTYVGETRIYSDDSVRWPGDGRTAAFRTSFSTSSPSDLVPETVGFNGEALTRDGRRLPGGTKVEAYVGDTLCGVGSVRAGGSFYGYILDVVSDDSVRGCTRGATITFRLDGQPALETAVNDPDRSAPLDLTLR